MKLKTHREDVKFLQQLCDIKLPSIARRYLNLIKFWETIYPNDYEIFDWMSPHLKRVLKDADV